ncbi:MAG: sarcosine oxidase subunit gamma family protein [Ornithinibacter sp.]
MTVETLTRVSRWSPLASWASRFETLPTAVGVKELPHLTQLGLRFDPAGPAAASVAAVLGTAVPTTPCTSVVAGAVTVLWLGPDEWLVVATADDDELLPALTGAVSGHGAVVEVSAQRTTVSIRGPRARDLLAHGCSADLDPRISPLGTCLQTPLALAGVVLVVRDDTATDFWVLVRSSFARYLADWVIDACAEYAEDPSWR